MPLPVLSAHAAASDADLLRLHAAARLRRAGHLAEEEVLDVGRAFCNPALAGVPDALQVRDAQVPAGWTAAATVALVEAHFAARSARCLAWAINPSAPEDCAAPLAAELVARGHRPCTADVMVLAHHALAPAPAPPGVLVIPARASFAHTQHLLDQRRAESALPPAATEAAMLHLDDPHQDGLLALRNGQALAHVGLLAAGEVGLLDDLYVAPSARGRGLGRLMLARALEACARSLFKWVFVAVAPDDAPARALATEVGFRPVGVATDYLAPAAR